MLIVIICVYIECIFRFGLIADLFDNAKSLLLLSLIVSNMILLLFYFSTTKSIIFGHFYLLLVVRGFRSYCNCIWSLIDAVTMKLITDKKTYGKHRLFGSLAWGVSALIVGKLIDSEGINIMFLYGIFWSCITFGLICFFMPTNIPNYQQHKYESLSAIDIDDKNTTLDQGEENGNGLQNESAEIGRLRSQSSSYNFYQIFTLLASMRHDYQFIFSLIIMLIYWTVMFIVDRILFIQMNQDFGATKFMNGIATLCSTLPAIPFFYYSSNLMKRYSMNTLYMFCHIVLTIRLSAFLLCKDLSMVWIIYICETLHGINFGLGFAICSVYLYQIGERYSMRNELGINVRATVQSLKGLMTLFSTFIGSIIWLPLYDNYDAETVYIYGAMILIPSAIVLWTKPIFL